MSESERELRAGSAFVTPPRLTEARASARSRIERQTAADVRGYGGRRLGFKVAAEEQAKIDAMERHLLELARRAIQKHAR